ncbi:Myosin binding subunit isoform 2 [Schistosoma japonicum]|uniref:Myosin binding subunit isoform 2 n=1 Tax=Schistosoma japonicum TaxID=6182 RepID=A0A4Z2D4B2_SCHJA|nr:Myosin binding subunit [Schistosoma japonicum]TNN11333.1 Myosin binding subunit isoform 2 [Schistosoma japonicum]
MLYGGPLGTYLSGLSSSSTSATSHLTSSGSTYNSPGSSNLSNTNYYSGVTGGLRRSSSRYRNSTVGSSNLSTTSTTLNTTTNNSSNISGSTSSTGTSSNPYSSYYTPPVRRKYGTPETDTPKPSRYLTRTQVHSSNIGSGTSSVNVGSSSGSTGTSASSYSGLPQYPRRSPNKIGSNANYAVGGIGTSSSWNSDLSSAASKTPNYKQLYEEEKVLTTGLREEVKAAQKELKELENSLEYSTGRRRSSDAEQRKMERRISECEQELKVSYAIIVK